jgi:hypothetical protein
MNHFVLKKDSEISPPRTQRGAAATEDSEYFPQSMS